MKKVLFVLAALLCGSVSFAQNAGTLNVIGEAKKSVLPDKAIVSITINAQKQTEQESFKKLNEVSAIVLKRLKADGFTDDQVKLTNFSMNYINWEQKKKPYYQASQSMDVKFKLDKERLFKIYNRLLADSVQGVQISFGTECSDELTKKVQEELIAMALDDAKAKAQIICKSSNCQLQSISNIGYKYYEMPTAPIRSTMRFVPPMIKADAEVVSDSSLSQNLSINEQEFSEEIKVTYTIVNR